VTRHIRWQILLIVLGAVLVAVLLAYLALKYTTVLRPGYGGTYVEGAIGSPQYVNPLLSGYNQTDRDICALVFSGLTRMSERGEVVPDMARGWDVSPDGLTYTFYLRSNLFWHDGTPLTADDVLFTIQLLQDPTFPGSPDLGLTLWHMVTAEKLDRRTVRFTLAEPYAPFLDYTTVGIVPAHVLTGTLPSELPGASFNLNPIGSGPFQLEEIQAEEGAITAVTLKLAPTYYRDRPYIDRVQFRFYPSFQTALNAFEAGEVEAISRVPAADIDRARAVPNLSLFSTHMARYSMILLNQQRDDLPFFREAEVRQALLYAIDRQGIIDRV